ncbi:MAG: alcohol dehydrogenase catalytic domain-containing protein [Thermodesulfobacteriota bacterium]
MKAAVYYNNSDVRVEEVPTPSAGAGELLVRIEASGICGSDVMEWYRIKKAPLVLGHEVAGTVEEVGEGVDRFKKGDRVTVAHHVPCNTCHWCQAGHHSVCETLRTTNFDPGGFAEYVRVPAINVERGTFRLPEKMSFTEGSFTEPLGCVIRGFRVADFQPGRRVLVVGSGLAGLLHVKLAKALGAEFIAATDISDYRLEAAKKFGADLTLRADREDVPVRIEDELGGLPDLVAVCSAEDAAITQAMKSVTRGGTILVFAARKPGETFPLPMFELWRDNVTIVNTYASCPEDTLEAIGLIGSGKVEVEDLVTHRFPLSGTGEGFGLAQRAGESLKVIIEPHA